MNVTIPSSVTNMGSGAFGNCVFLTTAYFQGNAPKVGNVDGSSDNTVFYGSTLNFVEAGVIYYPPGATGWGTTFGSWPTVCTSNITPISALTFLTNSGGITITEYLSTNQDVILPGSINGYPVTAIGDNAFRTNYQLRSVLFPNSVTSIGNQAFYDCYYLVSAPLPSSLASIGDQAFQLCSGVSYVMIPAGVTNIGNGAFLACASLLNITVAADNPNYASQGGVLFNSAYTTLIQYPTALAGDYIIPDSVTNIGSSAFFINTPGRLTSVTIPSNVLSIADSAFSHCPYLKSISVAVDNPNYTSVGGVLFDKALSTLIRYPGSMSSNYQIPNTVTRIGESAFYAAYGLQSVTIPDSVSDIGSNAFLYCSSLTNITVGAANPSYASSGGVLFNKAMTTLIQYPIKLPGNYAVPSGVTRIGDNAFYYCTVLTNVTIPDSVAELGDGAFYECYGLRSLALGNSIITIGNNAFLGCHNLPGLTIPSSVTHVGDYAFAYCYGLTSVVIPDTVSSIGQRSFLGCTALHQVYFQGNAPSVSGGAGSADDTVFQGESGTVFYQPGTTGWESTFGGWPTIAGSYQPQPQISGSGQGFGVQSNGFQFTIFWATNTAVVVEASTNLLNWTPVITNSLLSGTNAFSDSSWTDFPTRFYRVRSQ